MKRPIAVVTGAGQGVGAGIARRLARDGYEVVILEVDVPRAEAVAHELDGRALACDVSDYAQVEAAAAAIGPVKVLVNNAAVQVHKPVLECTPEELARVVQVNLLGVIYGCKAFAPGMMANGGGSIVSISSAAAPTAAVGHASYPAAKAGVDTLTRQLAQDWGHAQVRVNAVAPGAILTERNAHRFQGEIYEERLARIPLGRTGMPADIADVVSALCSHDMRYVTGQVIYVDGGMSAGAGRGR